jgi:hypothetical protein
MLRKSRERVPPSCPRRGQLNIYPRRRGRSAATAPASKRYKTIAPPAPAPAPVTPRRAARVVPEPEVQQQITSPASVLRSLADSTHSIGTCPRPANRALSISVNKRHLSPRLALNRLGDESSPRGRWVICAPA